MDPITMAIPVAAIEDSLNLQPLGLRVPHCARCYYMVGAEQGANSAVAVRTREIYRSANRDRWCWPAILDTARVFVRHEPNLPSGGQVADIKPIVVTCMWTTPHVIRLTTITLRHFGAGERAPSITSIADIQ
jgi:hypothetical protein